MINGPSLIDDVADVMEIQADLARLLDAIENMAGERIDIVEAIARSAKARLEKAERAFGRIAQLCTAAGADDQRGRRAA
ncbi:hypothetical protein [Sphingobium ummariense]|uniref:Uncharacterized protein n=1 Tax=Sphingobium ummariense RL-3 TaxID=1346791 RepID=T0KD99_9SPHN|nr:hypothetical protein [Sphingobium ummariense]EQB31513.1 hypothetical protein M529_14440 [Sphingobium ummariense RL-3]